MKRFKGLLVFVLVLASAFLLNNTKSFAEVVQYTDNVIPTMTSNTSPSGVATASDSYSDSYSTCDPWKAFDKNFYNYHDGKYYNWAVSSKTGWLAYEFPSSHTITKYAIHTYSDSFVTDGFPKDWTFEAWNGTSWIVLDTRSNITDWTNGVKKEFVFDNKVSYKKYRINITDNVSGTTNKWAVNIIIGELEMMETASAPTNFEATGGNANVTLSWSTVPDVSGYIIKRSTTQGGPYDKSITVSTGSAITYTDFEVANGTKYYYVISAIVSGKESPDSNEASATPTEKPTPPDHTGNTATLILTMTNGGIKEYNLPITDLDNFLTWYDNRSDGNGKTYYTFMKTSNIAPYLSVKEYISFDKISSFEIKEYNQ
jgi:hypothetical protein